MLLLGLSSLLLEIPNMCFSVKFWLTVAYRTQSRILQADWIMLDNSEQKKTLYINMPYFQDFSFTFSMSIDSIEDSYKVDMTDWGLRHCSQYFCSRFLSSLGCDGLLNHQKIEDQNYLFLSAKWRWAQSKVGFWVKITKTCKQIWRGPCIAVSNSCISEQEARASYCKPAS